MPTVQGESPGAAVTADQMQRSADASPAIDALHTDLGVYLNQPVSDILSRLGYAAIGSDPQTPAAGTNAPSSSPQSSATAAEEPSGSSSPIDPSQMIKPVTDALGLLGSGEFGQPDPTETLGGISQALDTVRGMVEEAMVHVAEAWQGDAADAAQEAAATAVADGEKVAEQALELRKSLTVAATAVRQAETRLIEIINVFWSKIAAIGPSIVFPWGMAAAVAAAVEAVTESVEVITETLGTLGEEAAGVTSAGAPVEVAAVGGLGPAATSLEPVMNALSGVMSSVMGSAGGASGPPRSGGDGGADPAVHDATSKAGANVSPPTAAGGAGFGAAGGGRGAGVPSVPMAARLVSPMAPVTPAPTSVAAGSDGARSGGGMPMGGAGPMAGGANTGRDGAHSAAAFLHTTDHDELAGGLRAVSPAVIGQSDHATSPDVELRI